MKGSGLFWVLLGLGALFSARKRLQVGPDDKVKDVYRMPWRRIAAGAGGLRKPGRGTALNPSAHGGFA